MVREDAVRFHIAATRVEDVAQPTAGPLLHVPLQPHLVGAAHNVAQLPVGLREAEQRRLVEEAQHALDDLAREGAQPT